VKEQPSSAALARGVKPFHAARSFGLARAWFALRRQIVWKSIVIFIMSQQLQ
jgi:hypothetical protein